MAKRRKKGGIITLGQKHKGQRKTQRKKPMKISKKSVAELILLIVGAIIAGLFIADNNLISDIVTKYQGVPAVHASEQVAPIAPIEPISTLYTPSQRAWLDKLERCESGKHSEITIFDSNNEYSYGILQFQMSTFIGFGEQYGLLPYGTTINDALPIIHDVKLQESIASRMLQNGLATHWQVCYHKINEPYPKN